MITVISGTNRLGSKTLLFAKKNQEILREIYPGEVKLLDLSSIAENWIHNNMYNAEQQAQSIANIQDDYVGAAKAFSIVVPEYNGGIPGFVKLFLDAISIRNYKANFSSKAVSLTGVASGRAGCLRGLDYLGNIFMHMGAEIIPNRLPISSIGQVIDENGIINEATLNAMQVQMQALSDSISSKD